jgi:protocatechuate 3,4-dioxygenase beta subunit
MRSSSLTSRLFPRTDLSRREMLGLAAKGAARVVVSQALMACGGDSSVASTAADTTSSGSTSACVLTASLTEGPFFVDEMLNRSDIRYDPVTGALSDGVLLNLTFNVSRATNSACTPLTGAYLDVWHADATGTYSDVSGNGNGSSGAGKKFLRGYQVTDANGIVKFTTIYPGWYSGRAVHIHFKLRLYAGSTKTYEFTSQFFFDDALTDTIHAQSPYNQKGQRNVRNSSDGIYNSLSAAEKKVLTLATSSAGGVFSGVINLAVSVG